MQFHVFFFRTIENSYLSINNDLQWNTWVKIQEHFIILEIFFLGVGYLMRLSVTLKRFGLSNSDVSGTCYNLMLHVKESGLINQVPHIDMNIVCGRSRIWIEPCLLVHCFPKSHFQDYQFLLENMTYFFKFGRNHVQTFLSQLQMWRVVSRHIPLCKSCSRASFFGGPAPVPPPQP